MNSRMQRLLKDLRCAVSQALEQSTEVGRTMHRIRQEGWALYLVVDRKRDGQGPQAYEVNSDTVVPDREVAFKIDGRDLSFLRSIGIDPTRRFRRRRTAGS